MFFTLSALLLRIFSNPLANVFQKQLANRGKSPLAINFFTYLFLTIGCLICIFILKLPNFGYEFWLYSFIGGIFGALGNACLIKALQFGELSILGPINSYKSIVGIFFAIFLLHEYPTKLGIAGILLIILGSYVIFDTQSEKFTFKLLKRKDIQYRIFALIFTAIEAVFIKKVILLSNPIASFFTWCIFGAFFAFWIMIMFKKTSYDKLTKPDFIKILSIAICVAIMQLSTNLLFSIMNVGYALALFQLSTLISVAFGFKFFNEKHLLEKFIGSIIMIFGSVLIILY